MTPGNLDIEDPSALLGYLRGERRIGKDETPRLTTLAGGVSNRTVLLERDNGESWVLKQALEKLRVQVEWHSDPRRIEREAMGMKRLAEISPPGTIAPLVFVDPAEHLLAMEAVPSPHENWKTMLMAGRLDSHHVRQFGELLGTIHRIGWQRREQFLREFGDRSFFESLRLEPYYLYAAERMPPAADFLRRLVGQTRATRHTLVHGDYSPKNVLVHDGRLVLLDHEVIHFGDGAFDLGFALTHLLSKAHFLGNRRRDFTDAAKLFWVTYRQALGGVSWEADLEARAVAHTLGCLLARCVGRSPLEYLTPQQKAKQAAVVCGAIDYPPARMAEWVDRFCASV